MTTTAETISYNAHPRPELPIVRDWDDLAKLAKEAGSHWFDADTLRYFGSRLLGSPRLLGTLDDGTRCYVGVTSEYDGFDRTGREYSVRLFWVRGDQVVRVSDSRTLDVVVFNVDRATIDGTEARYPTARQAHAARNQMYREANAGGPVPSPLV